MMTPVHDDDLVAALRTDGEKSGSLQPPATQEALAEESEPSAIPSRRCFGACTLRSATQASVPA
jgi:hypothetical protein